MKGIRKIIRKSLLEYYDVYPDFFDPIHNDKIAFYPNRLGNIQEDLVDDCDPGIDALIKEFIKNIPN